MNEPLGRTVGNALEVAESVACLKGSGPRDVMEVTYALGELMLVLAGTAKDAADARVQLERSVSSGAALAKFRRLVAAQGGDGRFIDEPATLPQAALRQPVPAARAGFVVDVDACGVALAALRLGAGRAKAEDQIDPAVGIAGLVKSGERIEAGAPLCVVHASGARPLAEALEILGSAIVIGDAAPPAVPLIGEVVG